MLVLVLIVGQAFGLPEVEDPIPARIGLSFIVGSAGAGGMFAGILSVIVQPRRREQFVGVGTLIGCSLGVAFYSASLLAQLFFAS
ncbi:MAG TPA: hypothetical protein VFJ61_12875 [Solirubrobacterales bacterium]|nr:hypothetical protein [Solirubrobacterales bacterium]